MTTTATLFYPTEKRSTIAMEHTIRAIKAELCDVIRGEIHVHYQDECIIVDITNPYWSYKWVSTQDEELFIKQHDADSLFYKIVKDYQDFILKLYFKH